MTAGDFEYAWKRALDPVTGSPVANSLCDVQGARAYHQSELADPGRAGVRTIVTNGPFGLTAWERGESMVLVRNLACRGRFAGNVQRLF